MLQFYFHRLTKCAHTHNALQMFYAAAAAAVNAQAADAAGTVCCWRSCYSNKQTDTERTSPPSK